jgi:hypothetical protein
VMARVQSVAVVRELADNQRIPDNWDGCYAFCPLPDLNRDGSRWVVDFRAVSNVDRTFLLPSNRIAALSAYGWAIFRQRLVLCYTRALTPVAKHYMNGRSTWFELELWQQWCASLPSDDFHEWYNKPTLELSGFSPIKMVQKGEGEWDDVQMLFQKHLAATVPAS